MHKVEVLGLPANAEKWDKILFNSVAFLDVIIMNFIPNLSVMGCVKFKKSAPPP